MGDTLTITSSENGAYRFLITANDLGFVDRALGYLTRSHKSSMKSRKEYLTMIHPICLINGIVDEINSEDTALKIFKHYKIQLPHIFEKLNVKELMKKLSRKRPAWGIFYLLAVSKCTTLFDLSQWMILLNSVDENNRIPDMIITAIERYRRSSASEEFLAYIYLHSYVDAVEHKNPIYDEKRLSRIKIVPGILGYIMILVAII